MRSEYHNVPTINGIDQRPGRAYAAKDAQFDEESGKLTLDLTSAYHPDAAIESYIRSAVIEDGKAIVCDQLTSKKDGEVTFNLLCNTEPEIVGEGCFKIHGKLVTNYRLSILDHRASDIGLNSCVGMVSTRQIKGQLARFFVKLRVLRRIDSAGTLIDAVDRGNVMIFRTH